MRELFAKYDAMLGLAVMFAAIVWACTTVYMRPSPPPRYTVIAAGAPGVVYRLDSRTGELLFCTGDRCLPIIYPKAGL